MKFCIEDIKLSIRYSWLGNLYYKVKHVIPATYKYFIYVCKNDDYDWDYSAMLNLIAWKARKMADCIEENGIVEADKRIAKQLRYLDYLIQRYYSEDDRIMDQYYEQYGHPVHGSEPGSLPNTRRLTIKYSSKEAEEMMTEYFMKAKEAEQKIKKRIFRHMERYIEGWWD